jgi:glycolate oxidase FAD binding subunit
MRRGWPVSATAWHEGVLHVRLSGSPRSVRAAVGECGGAELDDAAARSFWVAVREQTLPFFGGRDPLWRVSVPAQAESMSLPCAQLVEWGGALRWLSTSIDPTEIRQQAVARGGHATLFRRAPTGAPVFAPLPEPVARIEARIRAAFDPAGVFSSAPSHANQSR